MLTYGSKEPGSVMLPGFLMPLVSGFLDEIKNKKQEGKILLDTPPPISFPEVYVNEPE